MYQYIILSVFTIFRKKKTFGNSGIPRKSGKSNKKTGHLKKTDVTGNSKKSRYLKKRDI